ncbi:MAG: hypothetical protein JW744_03705 [Candidatus Diapherotrites archaeon]|uniref:Uncharacterized protein n=1 Tax=Candidatus Iainarchaeum sp. TaxID=3101447 RepID=A0A939C905_9ARCH|nr:hypothetical protein [Candidatus Diapherotrites archaeon]
MKVFLVSDSKTGINFFPELAGLLEKQVAGLRCQPVFVPFPEDVPAAVSKVVNEADLVFVFVLYAEKDFKIEALLSKLIDLEMNSKAKIVKAIEESDVEGLNEMQLSLEKQQLAKKWSKFILDCLFNPGSFKPKENARGGLPF